jgi:hypothetical protein
MRSIPSQTRRYLIAIRLSQQVPGRPWQVWHATKSVAGAFRGPRYCGMPHFLCGTTTLLLHFLRECSFWAVPSLSLSAQRDLFLFVIYTLDLETLTTLIMRSILGQQRSYQIAIRLSQEDPGNAWQVWHATKSVAGAFRGPRYCGMPHFLCGTTTLLPHFLTESSFAAGCPIQLSTQSFSFLFLFLMIDLETLTTLIMRSILGEQHSYQIAICLSQQVPGNAWQVWHATKSVAGVACHKKCGRCAFRCPRFYLSFY